eukprot:CFRG2708T1
MASTDTIMDLKMAILQDWLLCAPMDQHLSFEGRLLENNQTLEAAMIPSNAMLMLRVDAEPLSAQERADVLSQHECNGSRERGFEGTGLHSSVV